MFNPFKKKSEWEKAQEKVEKEQVENIRHQAELEERLKLAKEHGTFDAQKKYGKFKQPSAISNIITTVGKIAENTQANSQPTKGKKKKNDLTERADKMIKQLEEL